MPSEDLTAEALFQCRQCGQCCQGFGGTYLTSADIENIARFVGITPQALIDGYCTISGRKYVLRQKADGYCAFWDELCTIHAVKPRMCRAWPFIDSILHDPANWDAMAGACPGMRVGFDKTQVACCVKEQIAELDRLRGESK